MGAGSIGERYILLLQGMGYHNLFVYRQRQLPLRTVKASSLTTFNQLDKIDSILPSAAIICTPTFQHIGQSIFCLERKIPVLVEKPLSHNTYQLEYLEGLLKNSNTVHFQVAYMLRYHPYFLKIKSHIETNTLGKLLNIQTHWGEYLPDWHPWEDYRISYAVSKKMGGGAALTLSHDVDLCNWLSDSPVEKWQRISNFRSELTKEVDSGSDISIAYQNGVTAHCHVNFFERVPYRNYRFIFEEGTIYFDYAQTTLSILKPNQKPFIETLSNFHRDQLYIAQLHDFFSQITTINGKRNIQQLNESQIIIDICR